MFKVILADDEPVIIKGLRKLISWEKLNAQVVAEAENGKELLAKIEELSPDIVISDVAMPGMSGLEVLKAIREYDKNTKVIFLSGYQEFSYVKTAIRYEALEYLLKPVGKEELEQAVLKAEHILKKDRPLEYWQEEKDDMQTVFRKINSESECRELYEHFREMGIETEGRKFTGVCFLIPAGFYKKIGNQNMAELLRFSIFKKIQEYVKKENNGFVIKREANSSNLILILPKEEGRERIEQEIKEIREKIAQEYKVDLVVGIGGTTEHTGELKFAYKTAKFCADLHFFNQQDMIWYDSLSREFHYSFEDYNQKYKEMTGRIFSRDENWEEKLKETLALIECLHYGNRYAAENRCISMAMDLYKELAEYHILPQAVQEEYEAFVARIRNQPSFQELKNLICRYLTVLVEKYAFSQGTTENPTIRQVKEYMKEHYAENLTLERAAEVVYMNPYYFSSFFKKETGQNFKNYLAQLRMKEAVRLLLEKDMKTYELAKAVGYHDVRSFTEKFKEFFGDSPAGYKKAVKKRTEKEAEV